MEAATVAFTGVTIATAAGAVTGTTTIGARFFGAASPAGTGAAVEAATVAFTGVTIATAAAAVTGTTTIGAVTGTPTIAADAAATGTTAVAAAGAPEPGVSNPALDISKTGVELIVCRGWVLLWVSDVL
jgi:hypothetical protein